MVHVDRIRKVDIFEGLKDEELRVVSQFCQEARVFENSTLCEEGARADKLFILEEGTVSIRWEKGASLEIRGPGKILGWSFLVPPNRYTASVVTVTPSRLLVIKGPDFYEMVHRDSKTGLKIMDNIAKVVAGRLKASVELH